MARAPWIGLSLFLAAASVVALARAQDASPRPSRLSPTPVAPGAPPRVRVENTTGPVAGSSSVGSSSVGGSLADRLQGIRRTGGQDPSADSSETSSRRPRPPQPLDDSPRALNEPAALLPGGPGAASSMSDEPIRTARVLPSPPTALAAASASEPLISAAGPHVRVDAIGPAAVTLNRPTKFVVKAVNLEHAVASSVQVHLRLPAWIEVKGGEATRGAARPADAGGGEWIWAIDALGPLATEELTLSIIPTQTRPFDLQLSWTCAPPSQTASIVVQEPKLEMTISGPKDIMFGESKVYTISLANPGTGDAENVALTLMPLSPTQRPLEAKSIGTIKAGQRRDIDIELTARQAGMIAIKASAKAEGGLAAEAAEEVLVRRAELAIAITGPQLKYAGHPAEYRVRVANVGNAAALNVVATALLPSDAELISRGEGASGAGAGPVQFLVGQLGPNDARTFTFTCVMHRDGEFRIAAHARDGGDLAAEASTVTTVEALADLKLSVKDPPGPIPVGDEVTYEIRLTNRGSKAATAIDVAAFFSEGIEPVSVHGAQGRVAEGEVTFSPLDRLEPGAERVIKIVARAHQPGTHTFRAQVHCDTPETRLSVEDTKRFFGEPKSPPARQASRFEAPSPARGAESEEAAEVEPAGASRPEPGRFDP